MNAMPSLLKNAARRIVISPSPAASMMTPVCTERMMPICGPPFSVEPDEVRQLYGGQFEIEELERVNIINESPRFKDEGITALYEVAYRLTRL